MRKKTCFIALIFMLSFGLTLAWVLGVQISSGIAASPTGELHVCPSGCPYNNVQAAVDGADEGDIIKVAQGTYTGVSSREGVTQTVYLSKTLTIQGGYTTSNWITPYPEVNITTLDAQGKGRVLYIEGGYHGAPTIAGLHITGGNALGQSSNQNGGGVYCSRGEEIKLSNNHIFENIAQEGGGVYLDKGYDATLSENTISSNTAVDNGGGIKLFNGGYILSENIITTNTADQGGGLVTQYSNVILDGNNFSSNIAHTGGGGMFLWRSTIELNANVISSNTAQRGGGLASFSSQESYVNTLVADNQASLEGTGMYITGSPIQLWHTTLARNSGGDGSGIAIGNWDPWSATGPSTVALTNTILVSQSVGLNVTDGSVVDVDSILWYNSPFTITYVPEAVVTVQNQITGNPDFVDPGNGDYHISVTSAAHDVGIEAGVTTDIDNQVRPMGFGYDLGADEFGEAALSLVLGPSLVGVNVGGEITYQIVLTSSGTTNTSGVVLTDTLDSLQRVTEVVAPDANCTIDDSGWGGRVVCTPGTLNPGEFVTIFLTAQVSDSVPMGQAMTNHGVASANETINNTKQVTLYAQDCHVRIGDEVTEYTSVQAAVDAAYPTARVKVAGTCMGVYGPEEARQQVYLDQSLSIQGGYTTTNWTTPDPEANITTLDARRQGRVFFITEIEDVVIDGLYITGGDATALEEGMGGAGGGLQCWYASGITLSNNHIYGNTSGFGGGAYMGWCGNIDIIGNIFTANNGGGLALHACGGNGARCQVIENIFDSNNGDLGGGMSVDFVDVRLYRNTFVANTARAGGGLFVYLDGTVNEDGEPEFYYLLNENIFLSNTAERGGGLMISGGIGNATLTNTLIADNQASLEGAGVYITSALNVHLLHTTLARNRGGDGSGVHVGELYLWPWQQPGPSTMVMTNTILAYQEVGIKVSDASTVTVNGVLWHADPITLTQVYSATVWMQNQHTGDPAFLNPDDGDYHIGETSAARDTGVPSGVMWDIDGEPRPYGLGWDIGADEYFLNSTYLPLAIRN
jgi:parallel beta-helix repeat protein